MNTLIGILFNTGSGGKDYKNMGQANYSDGSPRRADPYKEEATNFIYNLLFCDDLALFKTETTYSYPFDVLFSAASVAKDYQKIIDDPSLESRIKVLAYNQQLATGHKPENRELLGVIIEVGLDDGLDVLASYVDGTARYINYSGKIIIWETADETSSKLTQDLFANSREIIKQIGPWDKPRRPHPGRGIARITFLVSDGLYFGEAPIDVLFNDPLASPALISGTELMRYLTEMGLEGSEE